MKYESHGKFLLAGEHAVLLGSPALVFPLLNQKLILHFEEKSIAHSPISDLPFSVSLIQDAEKSTASQNDLSDEIKNLLQHACQLLGKPLHSLTGKISIENHIPIGAGLGASAALCTAVAKCFQGRNLLANQDLFSFSKELENYFHGTSSGVDIIGALSDIPVIYHSLNDIESLEPKWQPYLYLSYSGEAGHTKNCVTQIQTLRTLQAKKAQMIDQQMQEAVSLAIAGLRSPKEEGLSQLQTAMNLACSCFEKWALITEKLNLHLAHLRKEGALAVKPTGSGKGGYVLSLWETPPPLHLCKNWIKMTSL